VRIRWVADEIFDASRANGEKRAPRAAVLLDLLESDEPRARREAIRALLRSQTDPVGRPFADV